MMLWNIRTLTLGAIAAQALIVHTARADQSDATLVGVVRDTETGEGIPGVVVVVTSPKLQGEKTVTTDEGGFYRIPNLPPGEYTIQVLGGGDQAETRTGIALRANTTIRQDVAITRGEGEVRKIEVEAPTVDVGSSSTGMRIDDEFTKRVPIAQPSAKGGANRSFESVAVATPTAQTDTYGTSIQGTTSPENAYLIDGVSVGNPGFGIVGMPLSMEFISQVDVIDGGYMPEFGRTGGGVMSAVTETGSNEFHGSVWGYYNPGQIQGDQKTPPRAGQTILTTPRLNWIGDVGFDLGGRIIKDKLWFYAGFDIARTVYDIDTSWQRVATNDDGTPQIDDDGNQVFEGIPGSGETFKAQSTNIQALAKLTWAAAENHTVSLTGIYAPYFSGGEDSFGISPRTGNPEVTNFSGQFDALAHQLNGNSANLLAEWQATALDNALTFDTILGWHHQENDRLPTDGSGVGTQNGLAGTPQTIWRRNMPNLHSVTDFIDLPPDAPDGACNDEMTPAGDTTVVCPVQQFVTGGPGFIYERTLERVQGRHIIGYSFRGAGHHLLKVGVNGEYMNYTNHRGYTGRRVYREAVDGSYFLDYRQYGFLTEPDQPVILDSLEWTSHSATIGAFAQDSWSIMDVLTLNAGLRWDGQFLWAGDGEYMLGLMRQFSPRLGLIYDFTQEGKSKLFANYARYYQGMSLDIADRAGSSEPLIAGLHAAAGGCDDPSTNQAPCRDPANQLPVGAPSDPNQNWIILNSGKMPIDPNIRAQSTDEFVAGGEYEVFPDARVGLAYNRRWLVRAIEDMSRDEATTYFIGNPGEGIAQDFPNAERTYDALTVYFRKDFSDHWLTTVSYTAAWLRGNFVGLFRPTTGQLDPNINSDFDLISLLENRTGWLPADRRHQFKVYSAGEIPLPANNFIMLGGGFQAQSGTPTNFLASHSLYGSGESFLLPRGSGKRLPWLFNVDTTIGYRYAFNEDVSIAVTMDVFNIINLQKPIAVDQNYTFQDVNPIPDGDEGDLESVTDVNGDPVVQNPNYGEPIAYQRPRQFRFGLRVTF